MHSADSHARRSPSPDRSLPTGSAGGGQLLNYFNKGSGELEVHRCRSECEEGKLEKVGGAVYSKLTERGTQGRVLLFVDIIALCFVLALLSVVVL